MNADAKWHEAMREARRWRYMARYAMPPTVRPLAKLLAKTAVFRARHLRVWGW